MSGNLDKLLLNASSSLNSDEPVLNEALLTIAGSLDNDLLNMLNKRNGFYALESALHVFPSHSSTREIGLYEWNDNKLWRYEYDYLANGYLFFAEDIFGNQFCIKNDSIFTFDAETAEVTLLAKNFEEWSSTILNDYNFLTGYSIAHEWQEKYGKLASGKRLVPKIPFVAGGEYKINNLYEMDTIKSMELRGNFANQIKELPDGSSIKFTFS